MDLQIRQDRPVDLMRSAIPKPCIQICFHIQQPDAVKCRNIKFPHGFVISRRVARSYKNPAIRDPMIAKLLVLQQLQHRRSQCLRDTVNLIDKKYPLFFSGPLHAVINGGYDLTHRIFRHRQLPSPVVFLYELRQSDCALPCVMRHRIADEPHLTFPGDLFHHRCLSNARRSDQKDRTLPHKRKCIASHCILMQICPQGMCDLFFCFLYVHIFVCSPFLSSALINGLVSCPLCRTPAPTSAPGASPPCALQKRKPSHSLGHSADKYRLHR